jgi:hypothetical protein
MRQPQVVAEVRRDRTPPEVEDRGDDRVWVEEEVAARPAKSREPLRKPVVEAVAWSPATPLAVQRRLWDQ